MLKPKHRVLVVDDSAYMRKVISDIIRSDMRLEVVGTARDGKEAIEKADSLSPDVITMDVEMPVMDGIEATRQIMAKSAVPVLMLSSLTRTGATATIEALAAGAVDFIQKPSGAISLDLASMSREILRKIKIAAGARPRNTQFLFAEPDSHRATTPKPPAKRPSAAGSGPWAVTIASSTGGPGALMEVFSSLGRLEAAVTVVQHMPTGFTKSLAKRLDGMSSMSVKEAEDGDVPQKGVAYIAPGGRHMLMAADGRLRLSDTPPVHGVRPAADPLMDSLVRHSKARIVGVVLTGMGFDGARGMASIKKSGGYTIAEDESTCVVYGMPRAVVEMGNADVVVPINLVAASIKNAISG